MVYAAPRMEGGQILDEFRSDAAVMLVVVAAAAVEKNERRCRHREERK